jgi:hypothetical protein
MSFSKTCPQLQQAYSKIGMGNRDHSIGLRSQLSRFDFPAGEVKRRAQVKREIPGMRGRTRNQTTRKRTKIKKFAMVKSYAPQAFTPSFRKKVIMGHQFVNAD